MSSCSKRKWSNHDDVFYTRRVVVDACIEDLVREVPNLRTVECIDFSAGDGYFCEMLSTKWSGSMTFHQYDTQPRSDKVRQQDWFDVKPFKCDFVGFNPPFGYKSGLVKAFLAHAAKFEPDVMAFIMPRVTWNILPPGYNIVYEKPLNDDSFYTPASFTANDKTVSVPGCRFVSAKKQQESVRPVPTVGKEKETLPPGVQRIPYSKPWPDHLVHGFCIRRIGANAGRVVYLIHGRDNITRINDRGETKTIAAFVQDDGVTPLSTVSFHTYITQTSPTADFGRRLIEKLRESWPKEAGGQIIPYGNAILYANCIVAAGAIHV